MGIYEAVQTAEVKNGSKHFMWTVIAAIAFTNTATQGLWWDSKKKRSTANAVVCHRPVHLRLSWRQTGLMSTAACYQ